MFPTLATLPAELRLKIANWLDPIALARLKQVCRAWRDLLSDDLLVIAFDRQLSLNAWRVSLFAEPQNIHECYHEAQEWGRDLSVLVHKMRAIRKKFFKLPLVNVEANILQTLIQRVNDSNDHEEDANLQAAIAFTAIQDWLNYVVSPYPVTIHQHLLWLIEVILKEPMLLRDPTNWGILVKAFFKLPRHIQLNLFMRYQLFHFESEKELITHFIGDWQNQPDSHAKNLLNTAQDTWQLQQGLCALKLAEVYPEMKEAILNPSPDRIDHLNRLAVNYWQSNDIAEELFIAMTRCAPFDIAFLIDVLCIGGNPNWQNIGGYSLLMLAARQSALAVRLLLAVGADVNARAENGTTALMDAAHLGDVEIVTLLIKAGANLNSQNVEGYSALMIAAKYCRLEIVQLLLAEGAAVDLQTIPVLPEDSDIPGGATALTLVGKAFDNRSHIRSERTENASAIKQLLQMTMALNQAHSFAEAILMIDETVDLALVKRTLMRFYARETTERLSGKNGNPEHILREFFKEKSKKVRLPATLPALFSQGATKVGKCSTDKLQPQSDVTNRFMNQSKESGKESGAASGYCRPRRHSLAY